MLVRGRFYFGGREKVDYQGKLYPKVQLLSGLTSDKAGVSDQLYEEVLKTSRDSEYDCELDVKIYDNGASVKLLSFRPAKQ